MITIIIIIADLTMQSTRHTRVVKWPRESLRLQVSPTNFINQQLKKIKIKNK